MTGAAPGSPSPGPLTDQVTGTLRAALTEAPSAECRAALEGALERLGQPLRVAIAGKVKAGKSTLLNALVGEELAPTDAGECTRIVTWYRDGPTYRVLMHPRDGEPAQLPFLRREGAIEVDLGGVPASDVDHLEVWWPSARLRQHSLIDTPGIASISVDLDARARQFLAQDEDHGAEADAVIYLLRHLHSTDVRFLEAFHDDGLPRTTPVNAIGVLSRADEIGSCRLDALEVAARVARRYENDATVRRLCSAVVPVAGLLAQGGSTLRQEDFGAIATLAEAPPAEVSELLLTADRFGSLSTTIPVPGPRRQQLLDRLGLFGVRFAERLVRTGRAPDAGTLAAELVGRSGLDQLRSLLLAQFAGRSQVLKARSALTVLRHALRTPGWQDVGRLRAELERITSGAHELVEIGLLNRLQSGELEVDEKLAGEVRRLLGGLGDDPPARLGLALDADQASLREAAIRALERWQRLAEHPMYDLAAREAAAKVVRSCEGILTRLTTSPAAR